jgi:hypothetical protein
MDNRKSAAYEWLELEHMGSEDEAEARFSGLFTTLPDVHPSPEFTTRAARAAWSARTRSRRIRTWAAACAIVLIAVFNGVATFGFLTAVAGWLVTGASLAASSTAQVFVAAAAAMTWWSFAARTGGTIAGVVALPQGAALLATTALAGAMALYLMRRLLRGDLTTRHPGSLCF